MNGRQQDLFTDLPRGEQLAMLRSIKLDPLNVGATRVSGKMQKAVLRAIDDHAGRQSCFASQQTLADEVGCSVASVGRAIAALVQRDLITIERPNHWASNHHVINWTEVARITKTNEIPTRKFDVSTRQSYGSDTSVLSVPGVNPVEDNRKCDGQNAPLIANTTDHLTGDWAAVAAEMREWGLASAVNAVQAAEARGWSIKYVEALFAEAGRGRDPERWEPGQLANWLTGKTPLPFDEAEAERHADRSHQANADKADQIRQSVEGDGRSRGIPYWLIAGLACRKLQAAELVEHATTNELEAARKMDAIDAGRARSPEPVVKSVVRRQERPVATLKTAPRLRRSNRQNEVRRRELVDELCGIASR